MWYNKQLQLIKSAKCILPCIAKAMLIPEAPTFHWWWLLISQEKNNQRNSKPICLSLEIKLACNFYGIRLSWTSHYHYWVSICRKTFSAHSNCWVHSFVHHRSRDHFLNTSKNRVVAPIQDGEVTQVEVLATKSGYLSSVPQNPHGKRKLDPQCCLLTLPVPNTHLSCRVSSFTHHTHKAIIYVFINTSISAALVKDSRSCPHWQHLSSPILSPVLYRNGTPAKASCICKNL